MKPEDVTTSPYGHGACPVCRRDISLTKAGMMRAHKVKVPDGAWPLNCVGSGQRPNGRV